MATRPSCIRVKSSNGVVHSFVSTVGLFMSLQVSVLLQGSTTRSPATCGEVAIKHGELKLQILAKLTLQSWVITLCTFRFNIKKFHVFPTECICVPCIEVRTYGDLLPATRAGETYCERMPKLSVFGTILPRVRENFQLQNRVVGSFILSVNVVVNHGLDWTIWGSNSGRACLPRCLHRLRGPLGLLYSGYGGLFLGDKEAGASGWPHISC
jgi:hypothetical protein